MEKDIQEKEQKTILLGNKYMEKNMGNYRNITTEKKYQYIGKNVGEIKVEQSKNIMVLQKYSKENIYIIVEEKEKNIIKIDQNLKENIY